MAFGIFSVVTSLLEKETVKRVNPMIKNIILIERCMVQFYQKTHKYDTGFGSPKHV